MSYSRSYSEVVTGSQTFSYPASQNGGSRTVQISIPVNINILVDTSPFDRSVNQCGNNIDLLTAAVVATESAEILSKKRNANKIADSIIDGFFGYIRSDISQQISELSTRIDSQILHLKELMLACVAKKNQMESDYNRISSRYGKIFDDLNAEIKNRVYELDKPTFIFKSEIDCQKIRAAENDLVNTVAISGIEGNELSSKISVSIVKRRALNALKSAKKFIHQQHGLNNSIGKCMLNDSKSFIYFSPVCFIETKDNDIKSTKNIFLASDLNSEKNLILDKFVVNNVPWYPTKEESLNKINMFLNLEFANKQFKNDKHSERVKNRFQSLTKDLKFNSIQN